MVYFFKNLVYIILALLVGHKLYKTVNVHFLTSN